MGALVHHASDFSVAVAPENHFLTQTGNTDRFTAANFLGFKDYIPLVGNHIRSPFDLKLEQL
jgi:hypothetical protein